MNIPLLDLKAQYALLRDEIRPALDRVIESQSFILGPEVEALEREIAAYCGSKYAIGVSSGTDGLLVALMALPICPGDEVITTAFSFFASAGVIARLQAVPVFVDIDPATFNIDPALIEKAVTPKTKAILPVHLFGQCADMDAILALAGKLKISVVEDACQSIGADYKGRKAGSLGIAGVYSFFPSKNLGGFGDGGMVVTDDPEFHDKIRLLRQHGSAKTYSHKLVGGNFRLDAIQAAILRVKLRHLDDWSAARHASAAYYNKRFKELGLLDRYIKAPIAAAPGSDSFHGHIYNQYTLRAQKRDALRAFLTARGIGTAVYYPLPLHLQECFAGLDHREGSFPEAEKASGEALSIPIYPELTTDQKDYIVQSIAGFYGEGRY